MLSGCCETSDHRVYVVISSRLPSFPNFSSTVFQRKSFILHCLLLSTITCGHRLFHLLRKFFNFEVISHYEERRRVEEYSEKNHWLPTMTTGVTHRKYSEMRFEPRALQCRGEKRVFKPICCRTPHQVDLFKWTSFPWVLLLNLNPVHLLLLTRPLHLFIYLIYLAIYPSVLWSLD